MASSDSMSVKLVPCSTRFAVLPENHGGTTREHGAEGYTDVTTLMRSDCICIKTEPYNTSCPVFLEYHEAKDELTTDDQQGVALARSTECVKEEHEDPRGALHSVCCTLDAQLTNSPRRPFLDCSKLSSITDNSLPQVKSETEEAVKEEHHDDSSSPLPEHEREVANEPPLEQRELGSVSLSRVEELGPAGLGADPGGTRDQKKDFGCGHCSATFSTAVQLEIHARLHNGDLQRYLCQMCPAAFSQRGDLSKHFDLAHLKHKLYKCLHCPAEFINPHHLRSHQEEAHPRETLHKCKLCPAEFEHLTDLKQHLVKHARQRSHQCDHCPATFKHSSSLRRHIHETHAAKKPREPGRCPTTSARSGGVQQHPLRRAEGKTYRCELCSMEFGTPLRLRLHVRTHTADRPYGCKLCPAKFSYFSSLKSHMEVHSGKAAPTACNKCHICNWTARCPRSLKRHLLRHQRPYECQLCPATFARRDELQHHGNVHSTEKRYRCKHCPAAFAWPSSLKRHMWSHIGGERPKHSGRLSLRLSFAGSSEQHVLEHTVDENLAVVKSSTLA